MKLLGSITEDSIRADLLASRRNLAESPAFARIRSALQHHFPGHRTADVLSWIPDEDEDLLTVLVDGRMVARFACPRSRGAPAATARLEPVRDYARGLRRVQDKLRLAIALDLTGRTRRKRNRGSRRPSGKA